MCHNLYETSWKSNLSLNFDLYKRINSPDHNAWQIPLKWLIPCLFFHSPKGIITRLKIDFYLHELSYNMRISRGYVNTAKKCCKVQVHVGLRLQRTWTSHFHTYAAPSFVSELHLLRILVREKRSPCGGLIIISTGTSTTAADVSNTTPE